MIASPSPRNTKSAFMGVRRVEWTLPMVLGRSPSRPALKMRRACEFVPAIKAPSVEVIPARKAKKSPTAKVSFATERNGTVALLSAVTLSLNPTTVENAKNV